MDPKHSRFDVEPAAENDDHAAIATTKDGQHYILFYRQSDPTTALKELERWARDSELNFNWYDAARLSKYLR